MDEDRFVELGERLVCDLEGALLERRTKKWRCPTELKARVLSYATVCRERGEPIEDIASRLGLVGATLARWLRQERRELAAGFRTVAIVSAEDGPGGGADRPLRLLTPRGYCVEGLDPQTLAYLLRIVG